MNQLKYKWVCLGVLLLLTPFRGTYADGSREIERPRRFQWCVYLMDRNAVNMTTAPNGGNAVSELEAMELLRDFFSVSSLTELKKEGGIPRFFADNGLICQLKGFETINDLTIGANLFLDAFDSSIPLAPGSDIAIKKFQLTLSEHSKIRIMRFKRDIGGHVVTIQLKSEPQGNRYAPVTKLLLQHLPSGQLFVDVVTDQSLIGPGTHFQCDF